jgi:hypothetical protein
VDSKQVQCSTQYRSFYVRLQGYRVVWQLQWTARRRVKLITPGWQGRSVECRAEKMEVFVCRYGCRTVKIWRVPRRNSTLADTIQLVKSAAEPSTVLETAALQETSRSSHHSINLWGPLERKGKQAPLSLFQCKKLWTALTKMSRFLRSIFHCHYHIVLKVYAALWQTSKTSCCLTTIVHALYDYVRY